MDNTPFSKKCEILNDWHYIVNEFDQHNSDYWIKFWDIHDLGFLVINCVGEGLVSPQHVSNTGVIYLDEMWEAFTLYMGIGVLDDNETSFDNLEQLLDYVDYPVDW